MTKSATVATPQTREQRSRRGGIWLHVGVLASISIVLLAVFALSAHWPYRYRIIKPMLEEVLGAQVAIVRYHRTYFPAPGFMATGVTLDRNPAPGIPPLGTIHSIFVQGDWLDLLTLRERVRKVDITGLQLNIPAPGSPASKKDFPPGSSSSFSGPETFIDELLIHDSTLNIMRAKGGVYAFPIKMLTVRKLQKGRVLFYSVDMRNPRPGGHIVSEGSFGPLNAMNLGATPLSGHFKFDQANLHDIGDISGTLSSTGSFQGNMASIEAAVSTFTPDFAVDGGKPTPVSTSAHCTINALNGDVHLDAIDAKFGSTAIHFQGGVVGSPKVADVDIHISAGRAQDVLRPFLRVDSPIAGIVWLQSHAHVDPAAQGVPFLQRLHVEGTFNVPSERLTNRKTAQELSAFSERAQKAQPFKAEAADKSTPGDEAHGGAADVVSSFKGVAKIEKGTITTQRLEFEVPGSSVDLHGSFRIHDGSVHLNGNLSMQADVSHVATGFKSFLLKPLIPFFKKRKAGAVIPIVVTGKPGSYKISQDVFGKK